MLANFFEKTKPINSIVLFAMYCSLFFGMLFLRSDIKEEDGALVNGVWGFFLNMLLVFASGVLVMKYKLSKDNMYFLYILVLLYGFFPQSLLYGKSLLISLLFVLFFGRVVSLSNQGEDVSKLFDSGLIIGVCFLLNGWLSFFLLPIYAALLFFNKVTIQNFVVPIIGALTPVFLFFTYCYVSDTMLFFEEQISFHWNYEFDLYTTSVKITFWILGALVTISLMSSASKVLSVSNKYQHYWLLMLMCLIIWIGIFLFTAVESNAEFVYLFFPVSLFLTHLIEDQSKRWMKELLLGGLLIGAISSLLFF